jgi:CelD/BcsL family acetyltransferase involved in cellulose biosynthesis
MGDWRHISTRLRLAVIAERAEFDTVEPEWNALFERAGRPFHLFQRYDWLWHWANHYLDERTRLSVVVGRTDDRIVLIWPLVITRSAGVRRLAWMGEPLVQYGDALVENGATDLLHDSWSFVSTLGADLVDLRKTRADAAVRPLLMEAGAVATGVCAAPYVDLVRSGNGGTFQERYSAKTRSNWRRHLRRLQGLGTVTFEQHGCGAAAHDLVAYALALKRGWLAQRGLVSPSLQDGRLDRFLRELALDAGRSPGIRVSSMRCNGKPVAVEISFACKGHVFGDIIAHAVELEKFGVGVLLAEYSIRTAHEDGYARFDLLAPADAYKLAWADEGVVVADWAVPFSSLGSLYLRLWVGSCRLWVKLVGRNLPRPLARLASALCRWRTRRDHRTGGARQRAIPQLP